MSKNYIDRLGLIYMKKGKLLCIREVGRHFFYLPGNERREGEDDVTALIRGVKEHISVDLIPESIHKYKVFEGQADAEPDGVVIRLTLYFANVKGEIKPANNVVETDWLSFADKPRIPETGYQVFDDLKKIGLLT